MSSGGGGAGAAAVAAVVVFWLPPIPHTHTNLRPVSLAPGGMGSS